MKTSNLQDLDLKTILPPSIASDEKVKAICDAINGKLQEIAAKTRLVLLLPRLDELPEEIVDALAWQWHVDYYDYTADISTKRALVRKSILWHKYRGTPAAVQEICAEVFQSAVVEENWDYGGEPYHFRVRMIGEALPDESVIDELYRAIMKSKNVRSWLDELSFYRECYAGIYYAMPLSIARVVSIYPKTIDLTDMRSKVYYGMPHGWYRKVVIK